MARTASLTKRSLITKANSRIVWTSAIAAFVVVFTLVAARALISQASYQNRVISTKKKALATLQSDLNARDSLVNSYKSFVDTPQNVLGGNPKGSGDQDGDNAKIILDALPSKYDFPALATSLEKLIAGQGLVITSISGTDEEATQATTQASGAPAPVPMPFQVQVSGSYENIKKLIDVFERSIRPIQVQKIEFSGDEGSMNVVIDAQTFYQPEKTLNIKNEGSPMKQKDIVLIVVIAIVSGVASLLVSGWIFAKPADRQQKAEVVDVITSDFDLPDSKYFNANAIDPTQLIQIGDTNNPNPFGQ